MKSVWLAMMMLGSLALISAQGSGQDSFHTAANRRHNRWEGPTERLHSLSDLALVGFSAFREAVDRSKGPVLRIGVFVPRCGDVRISASELLETDASYAMESLPQAWNRGAWDDHFVWETKTWIQPQGIELDNLGILAEVDCPAGPERWIAPVLVYREGGSPPARISRYRLEFKPGESLKRVRLFVGRWEDQAVPEAPAVELGSQAKLMPFPIDFGVPGSFGPEADVRLTVVGEYRYREGRFKTEYRFRHVSAYGTRKDR